MVSFGSSIIKNIVVFPALSRFEVKLICCISFRLASSACCLLKYILLLFYNNFWNNYSPKNNQLCNHLLDLLQFFIFYCCSLLLLQSEENMACNFFDVHHLQMIKQKVYLLPENLDQLSGLNISFVYVFLVLIDIYFS